MKKMVVSIELDADGVPRRAEIQGVDVTDNLSEIEFDISSGVPATVTFTLYCTDLRVILPRSEEDE